MVLGIQRQRRSQTIGLEYSERGTFIIQAGMDAGMLPRDMREVNHTDQEA